MVIGSPGTAPEDDDPEPEEPEADDPYQAGFAGCSLMITSPFPV
jgi:hypothetical protein